MSCLRCRGRVYQMNMYDLPKQWKEFCCLNCGERFWVHPQELALKFSLN